MDTIPQVFIGFFSGLVGGIIGFSIDLAIGSIFDAFGTINPIFILLGIGYAFFSFIMGTEEAYYAGFFFALGIIGAGLLLSDIVTTLGGIISFGGLFIGYYNQETSD
jgi:hypothetical protein